MRKNGERHVGECLWWHDGRGFGAVSCRNPQTGEIESLLVHYTAIKGIGHRFLIPSNPYSFIRVETPHGLRALDVEEANVKDNANERTCHLS